MRLCPFGPRTIGGPRDLIKYINNSIRLFLSRFLFMGCTAWLCTSVLLLLRKLSTLHCFAREIHFASLSEAKISPPRCFMAVTLYIKLYVSRLTLRAHFAFYILHCARRIVSNNSKISADISTRFVGVILLNGELVRFDVTHRLNFMRLRSSCLRHSCCVRGKEISIK